MLKSMYLTFSFGKQSYDMKIPQFLENKGPDLACNLLWDTYLVYSRKLEVVWNSSPQTYWADNPPADLVKTHFLLLFVGWSPNFYISNHLLQVRRPSEVEEILKGLIKVRLHPQIPLSPKKSRAGFILACKILTNKQTNKQQKKNSASQNGNWHELCS